MSDAQSDSPASAALDDSGDGLALFVIFIAAVLIVTGAVAIVALVNAWWFLGVAFAIHVLMTTVVVATIISVMNGRTSTDGTRAPLNNRPRETRPPTPIEPVTAA